MATQWCSVARRVRLLAAFFLALPAAAGASILQQVSPAPTVYSLGTDFVDGWTGSALGDVTANVSGIDIQLGLGNLADSGCEAADFAGFPAGFIALMQRGVCAYAVKVSNAIAAGAVGALIFNQGNTLDRQDAVAGNLGFAFSIPVLGLSYSLGAELSQTPGLLIHMVVTEAEVPSVPVPGSLQLLALGALGLGWSRRRRQ